MTYSTLLAVLSGAAEDADVMAAAAGLSKGFGGQVRVLPALANAMVDLRAPSEPAFTSARTLLASPQVGQTLAFEAMLDEIEIAAMRAGLRFGVDDDDDIVVRPRTCAPWHALQAELPVTDLVLMGSQQARELGPFADCMADVLLAGRSPLLVVRGSQALLGEPAAIAWDGSVEAGHAVKAAVPLLQQASSVTVLYDPEGLDWIERRAFDLERFLSYLRRRGVRRPAVETVSGVGEGPALLQAAQDRGVRLLVSGAYGHSRLREAMLGGTSRSFLQARAGPSVLLCH